MVLDHLNNFQRIIAGKGRPSRQQRQLLDTGQVVGTLCIESAEQVTPGNPDQRVKTLRHCRAARRSDHMVLRRVGRQETTVRRVEASLRSAGLE
jgi:hypothetical protein